MKKLNLKVAALLVAGSLLGSSCIGSFALFNKYSAWQREMTGNKYVNGIVGFVLQPVVGGICLAVDYVVLNTIEFWTNNNPVAANIGKSSTIIGQDGRVYAILTTAEGYEITAPDGSVTTLKHIGETDSWVMIQNGVTKELFSYNPDGTVTIELNGKQTTVEPTAQALFNLQMQHGATMFALQ